MIQSIDNAILQWAGGLLGLGLAAFAVSVVAMGVVLACRRSHPTLQSSALLACLSALLLLPLALPVLERAAGAMGNLEAARELAGGDRV